MGELDFMDRAACKGKTFYFFDEMSYDYAKSICKKCPVKEECLKYAMTPPVDHDGIFGGLDPLERQNLHRRNRRRAS